MKKLLFLGMSTLFLFSACKKDVVNHSKVDNMRPQLSSSLPQDVEDFLEAFYTESFDVGQDILTTEGETTFKVIEIILGEDTRARGYVVINYTTGDFVYFADVDRVNHVLTLHTIGLEDPVVYNDIDQLEEYDATNEFDYIFGISNVEDDMDPTGDPDPEIKAKRPFWGTVVTPIGPCLFGEQVVMTQHYAFWIKNGPPQYPEETIPC